MKLEVIETTGRIRKSLFGNISEALRACGITGKVVVVKDIGQWYFPPVSEPACRYNVIFAD